MKTNQRAEQTVDRELINHLQCPECQSQTSELRETEDADKAELVCSACDAHFPVDRGMPDLTPHRQLLGERWEIWKKHLEGYRTRSEARVAKPSTSQLQRWAEKEKAFADFIEAPNGRVLEVGCGPGSISDHLSVSVEYYGLDPLPAKQSVSFPFVVGVAEFLPFRDDTFDFLIVRSALDHFCYLDRYFAEAKRILRPDGKLFVEQVIHEVHGPISATKVLAHSVKDWLDDWGKKADPDAPKHISEFSRDKLMQECSQLFDIQRREEYNRNWYTPTQVFLCLTPTTKS